MNLVFGKYVPLNSVLHRVDPRSKIIALFVLLVAIFVPDSWWAYLALSLFCILLCALSKISAKTVLKTFKPLIFMMVFLLVINCLSIKTGDVLAEAFGFAVYSDAVFNTLKTVVRLLLMIIITTVLTATTKPLDLTLGIEYLLKPLRVVKFPVHEMAMMISIALRFIPTIIEETMRIMNAQKSRGVDFEEGSLKEKINAILSLIVPLFSVAFERAYELADAMEARGYVPGNARTRYKELKFGFIDAVYMLSAIAILAFSIFTKIYL